MDDGCGVVLDLIELFLNAVLYQRHIYPDGIFRKRRSYGMFSYISIFPPLQNYIRDILETAQELFQAKTLYGVEVIFLQGERIIEKHRLAVKDFSLKGGGSSRFEAEELIKILLLRLEQRTKSLTALPPKCCFKIHLETTAQSLRQLGARDVPWIMSEMESKPDPDALQLIPVSMDNKMGLHIDILQRVS